MLGNVLVVGGSASIAAEVIDEMVSGSNQVNVTYRSLATVHPHQAVNALECDLGNAASRARLVDSLTAKEGGIDVVLILVGAINGKNLEASSDDDMQELFDANFLGPARLIRDLLPVLNAGARLLIVSSISGQRGSYDPIYAASKGALLPFGKSLATWMGKHITVTLITPGAIEDSSMVQSMDEKRIEFHRNSSPTGKLLKRADFAKILYDLSHSHWSHANGAVINVNGGSYV